MNKEGSEERKKERKKKITKRKEGEELATFSFSLLCFFLPLFRSDLHY